MKINSEKPILNPITGQLDFVADLAKGVTARNTILGDLRIPNDFTRTQGNPKIPEGVTVVIEDGGEFIVL